MTDFETYIATNQSVGVTPDRLRELGKTAAARFISDAVPLSDTIRIMVKEAGLSKEQTKRVIEIANNETFGLLFRAGFQNNIEFPVADPGQIFSSAEKEVIKTASLHGEKKESLLDLVDIFPGVEADIEKTAEASLGEAARNLVERKRELSNHEADMHLLLDEFKIKRAGLYRVCKEARMSGNSAEFVGAAVDLAKPSLGLQVILEEDLGGLAKLGALEAVEGQGYVPEDNQQITSLAGELQAIADRLVDMQGVADKVRFAIQELLEILQGQEASGTPAVFGAGEQQAVKQETGQQDATQ